MDIKQDLEKIFYPHLENNQLFCKTCTNCFFGLWAICSRKCL